MKKVFLALMCVAAIALVGCKGTASNPLPGGTNGSSLTPEKIAKLNNTDEKCWQLGIGVSAGGHSEVSYDYMWCTEQEAAQWAYECYQASKLMPVGSAEYAYKESSAKTVEECNKLAEEAEKENGGDDDDENASCWEIYSEIAGTTQTMQLIWTSEEGVKEFVAALNNAAGGAITYKYKKVDADSEDKCLGVND